MKRKFESSDSGTITKYHLYLLREFWRKNFENVVELNFAEKPDYKQFFTHLLFR